MPSVVDLSGNNLPVSVLKNNVLTGAFVGTGSSPAIEVCGDFNMSLQGTFDATVQLERSFDDGVTYEVVSKNENGDAAAYEAPCSLVGYEPERGVLYRLTCSVFASGSAEFRLSN